MKAIYTITVDVPSGTRPSEAATKLATIEEKLTALIGDKALAGTATLDSRMATGAGRKPATATPPTS